MDSTWFADNSLTQADKARMMARLHALSQLLDNAFEIPLINYRIGIDALIGVIPGIGDAAGALVSAYIVYEAARMNAPKSVLAQMIMNIALEFIIGSVPVIGDLFDAAFKANIRNMRLLEAALGMRPSQ